MRLMLDQPYLATAIASLPFVPVETEWCPTAATDGFRVFLNVEWCLSLEPHDLEFVIAHEVMHCILGHADRRQHRVPILWNIAADYAVNGLLHECGFEVPDGGLWKWSYLRLATEEIYDEILSGDESGEGDGGRSTGAGPPGAGGKRHLEGFDLHLDPDSALTDGISGLLPLPTPEERRRLRKRFGQDLGQALHGKNAGSAEVEIVSAGEKKVPWQALLAHFVSGLRRSDYRLFPFNRKHIWNGLYLPSLGVPGPRHVVAAVDTSGSILSELDALRAQTECLLTLVQCDAEIQKVERLEAFEAASISTAGRKGFRGRGGTDFVPLFTWLRKEVRQNPDTPDALFCLTDGFGSFPSEVPAVPVLWIVPPQGSKEFPFGDVLRLES
jgi:predicted metal-dependent peptidase